MQNQANSFPEINFAEMADKPLEAIIKQAVLMYFSIDEGVLKKKGGKVGNEITFKKRILYFMLKKNTYMSFDTIGEFCEVPATTVKSAYYKIEGEMTVYRRITNEVDNIQKIIDNFNHQKLKWLTHNNN